MSTIDPVTAIVVRSAMETICFEMATYVSRTATTRILNQSNERNATILTGDGRLAALSVGIPQFMLSSTLPVRFACEFLAGELHPGDVIVANDPYHGGGHLPDFNVFSPVFDDEGVLLLFASTQCHHGDTGGAMAGGYNVFAKDIWSEGTRYPLLKIVDAGKERRDVVLTMRQQPPPRVHRRPALAGRRGAAGCAPAAGGHRGARVGDRRGGGGMVDRGRGPAVPGRDLGLARRHVRGRRLRRLGPRGQRGHPCPRRRHRRRRPPRHRLRGIRRPAGHLGVVDVRQHAGQCHRAARQPRRPNDSEERGFLRLPRAARAGRMLPEPGRGQARVERDAPPGCRGRRCHRRRDEPDHPGSLRAADLQVRQPAPDVGRPRPRARESRSSTTAAKSALVGSAPCVASTVGVPSPVRSAT
jgi:hypothetical protein